MKSEFLKLDKKDILRSAGITAAATILIGVQAFLPALYTYGRLPTSDQVIAVIGAGISAGIAYLGKNLLTSSDDEFLQKEDKT